uniref:Ribosomal RNA large subunit methyltransferase H n=1 Tax=Attheya septentrionalis TaxID=420275 RepID=A0A7S2XIV0_9STRA|mmetsp:Transcript_11892/g.21614  ORF Transcript_11892/g.21614 Transcript_11892/m.21614 type:complete len:212 (+) Transcript_11892:78-713(+)
MIFFLISALLISCGIHAVEALSTPSFSRDLTQSRFVTRSRTSLTTNGVRRSRSSLCMGMEVRIRIVGRKNGSEKWLEDAYSMYETRLRPSNIDVETIWHKNDQELIKGVKGDSDKGHTVVLLDPRGKPRTSEQFSENMYTWLDQGGSRLSFVIGGAEGLPYELRDGSYNPKKSLILFSLSALTFTHQFARTLLMEQIYRASEIRKGSGYHK